eukprot:symbB.v1.2.036846.t1/scaffold5288.1/size28833/2
MAFPLLAGPLRFAPLEQAGPPLSNSLRDPMAYILSCHFGWLHRGNHSALASRWNRFMAVRYTSGPMPSMLQPRNPKCSVKTLNSVALEVIKFFEYGDTVLVLLRRARVVHLNLQIYHHAFVLVMIWSWLQHHMSKEGASPRQLEAAAHMSSNRTVLAHASFWYRICWQSTLAALVRLFCDVG